MCEVTEQLCWVMFMLFCTTMKTPPYYQTNRSLLSEPVSRLASPKGRDVWFKACAESKKPILPVPPWSPWVELSPLKELFSNTCYYYLAPLCKLKDVQSQHGSFERQGRNVLKLVTFRPLYPPQKS